MEKIYKTIKKYKKIKRKNFINGILTKSYTTVYIDTGSRSKAYPVLSTISESS